MQDIVRERLIGHMILVVHCCRDASFWRQGERLYDGDMDGEEPVNMDADGLGIDIYSHPS